MPTEDEARTLLAKAAATIEVDDTAPLTLTGLPEPHARRWPILAAAAAVVLAIGGGYLVAQQFGNDGGRQPAPPPASQDETTVASDLQMPGVIGYTQEEATARLETRGFQVRVLLQPQGCNTPGMVTGSTPAVGTPVDPGDTVTIRVITRMQVVDCVGEVPWHLVWDVVRAARGIVVPESARSVPDRVLASIEGLLDEPREDGSPFIAARWIYANDRCWPKSDSGAIRFWVEVPTDGQFCPATSVVIEFGIDSISVRIDGATSGDESTNPEVVELSSARQESADAFVAWARGDGPAPAFADRVRVMFFGGGAFGSTGWANDPENRGQYAGCSGLGFPDCGVDPVAMIYRYDGRVAISAGRSVCADGGVVPKRFAEAEQDAVSLSEPAPCSALVELWIDEDGVIYGVNQAGSN